MRLRDFFRLLGSAASEWSEDNALRLSAALAYYSIFSLAPLLVIAISIAGLVFGEAAARGQITEQMRQLAGDRAAEAIQALVQGTSRRTASLSATFVGLVVLLFGSSGVFLELKGALNTIWGVAIRPGKPMRTLIRERFISFTIVLGIGFLLLVSLVMSAALAALGASMRNLLTWPAFVWQIVDLLVSFAVTTFLFAMIFKILPNVQIRWRDVWTGAGITAFLFTIGKYLIGFYLGTSAVASYYGAAGSAIVLLLWVYYSACILFFGAEFTKSYVQKYGCGILPDKRAIFRPGVPAGKVS
jgi:membrane protein